MGSIFEHLDKIQAMGYQSTKKKLKWNETLFFPRTLVLPKRYFATWVVLNQEELSIE